MLTAKPSDDEASLPRRLLPPEVFSVAGPGLPESFFFGVRAGLRRLVEIYLGFFVSEEPLQG